jgi:hypothetical protein
MVGGTQAEVNVDQLPALGMQHETRTVRFQRIVSNPETTSILDTAGLLGPVNATGKVESPR